LQKQEVVAYLIRESVSNPVKPINLKKINTDNLFYLQFDTVLQEFNIRNRNERLYVDKPMMESLAAPHINELISKQSWCGEAGHPTSDDPKRILTIDPKLISHKILTFNLSGNLLKGTIQTLDNDHFGKDMTKSVLQGMEAAFSLRALAKVVKTATGGLINSRGHIVTYDWVILPSHDKAYRDDSVPIKKIIKNIELSGNSIQESVLTTVQESQIADFIKTESKNIKLVSNIYEVVTESMQVTSDFKNVILKENGSTFIVKIEDKIKRDITHYMSRI